MWSLYDNNKFLNPLCFSNGKNQEDIVKEVLDEIKKGEKIIFIKGVCGTGKSAIALNIARKLGRTSIVVPGKGLQKQYKDDYEEKKYVLDENNKKLKIKVITGRKNHKCRFLEDKKIIIPKIKKEINASLDIFDKKQDLEEEKQEENSADVWDLPCKIEIKEKNWRKLKEYLKQNKKIDLSKFSDIKDITRSSIASICPYWSPVLPSKYELKSFPDSKKRYYEGLEGTKFIIHQGKPGCGFYEQFNSYLTADVLVFNSSKYLLESALNRKPLTEAEIIDECDEFLDKFSNQRTINLDRLQNALIYAISFNEKFDKAFKELSEILKQIKKDEKIKDAISSGEIISLKETGVYDLLKIFLEIPEFLSEIDDESYLFDLEETAKMFEDFLDESYVTFSKKENQIIASTVTTNLAKRFKKLVDKNKRIIMMSGTIHSEEVLKKIFGIENFKIIDAETQSQGEINILKTGLEIDCKYSNFSNGRFSREDYLKALDKCVEIAKKPVLVHINAFSDLPNKEELERYNLFNLITREKLKELQNKDKEGKIIEKFKRGDIKILFSTKTSRGIDFPGEQCNSIVFTKYPNPNVKDSFWKILNKTQPQNYWSFYKDKARRELWQRVYRGLRFKDDKVDVLSPDIRVLDAFEK
ncbi:hypothetical protein DRN73_06320 [Candidatus Pacearchaeota archaeon]|nr:MAG: hypothetical protein DRN73_06320 [Candidatus Pacearchaeota archaeon]